jgi:uncharacterized membrane protein
MSDRVQLKRDAKLIMKEKARPVYLITILYLVIGTIVGLLTQSVIGLNRWVNEINEISWSYQYESLDLNLYSERLENAMNDFIERLTPFAGLLGLILSIVLSIVAFGCVMAFLRLSRRQDTDVRTLFDGFAHTVKLIGLQIMIGIFVFLWSLLLIVPGIIASFRYSMAMWILADDPSKGIMQCIRESKEMMRGHKGEMFVLELSFMGWICVGAFIEGLLRIFIGVDIPIFSIWLLPYMYLTIAGFYNRVSGMDRAGGA